MPVELAYYSVEATGAAIAEVSLNEALRAAIKGSPAIKLRTLDVMHLALCRLAGAWLFVTFDKVKGETDKGGPWRKGCALNGLV